MATAGSRFAHVLQEMGVGYLQPLFQRENIDDASAKNLSDTELQKLGLETIGDRHRFRSKMATATSAVACGEGGHRDGGNISDIATNLLSERNRLFGRSTGNSKKKKSTKFTGWTAQFFCLSQTDTEKVPTSFEKQILTKAGLGLKKIKLENSDNEMNVIQKVMSEDGFPQLANAGGVEFLRSTQNNRSMTLIQTHWNSQELKSYMGSQARIYIRPLQHSLSLQPMQELNTEEEYTTICEVCHIPVKLREMRQHLQYCIELPELSGDVNVELSESSVNQAATARADSFSNETSNEPVYLVQDEFENVTVVVNADAAENAEVPSANTAEVAEVQATRTDTAEVAEVLSRDTADVAEVIENVVEFCNQNNIENPVEILKKLQQCIVTGRALELSSTEDIIEGATHYVLVDRSNLIETAFDELQSKTETELRCTLEVQFYDETAEDYGGPRKEFLRLLLGAIKEKYFDNGMRDLLADDYITVGVVFALSLLQNGPVPNFMEDTIRQSLWDDPFPSPCIRKMREGLDKLGIFQIVTRLPVLQYLFHPREVTMTVKRVTTLLKPEFSEEGSNIATYQKAVYSKFIKYLREVASGRRQGVNLRNITRFVTGAEEEPVLGFNLAPSIQFTDSDSFIPTAQTCINRLLLPRGSHLQNLPADDHLFKLYDYAFVNEFYGLK